MSKDLSKEIQQLVNNPIGLDEDTPVGLAYWQERAEVFRNKVTELIRDNALGGDIDEMLLESLVRSYRRIIELHHETLVGGMVIDSPQGKKANPALSSLQCEERIFAGHLRAFGMSPQSRANRDGAIATKPVHGNHSKNKVLKLFNG